MTSLVRREVIFSADEDDLLRRRAHELGVSAEDLIRAAVRQIVEGTANRDATNDLWQEALDFMRTRGSATGADAASQQGRTWTREELYDERLDRYSR